MPKNDKVAAFFADHPEIDHANGISAAELARRAPAAARLIADATSGDAQARALEAEATLGAALEMVKLYGDALKELREALDAMEADPDNVAAWTRVQAARERAAEVQG